MGKVYQRAVMWCPGIIFPTPYPQGYGATPPLPRPPQSACDVPGSMPEAAPYGNAGCVVHRSLREQGTAFGDRRVGGAIGHTPAPQSYGTARSAPKSSTRGRRGGTMPETVAAAVFSCSPAPVARVAFGTSVDPSAGTPTDRMPPSVQVPPSPSRPAGSRRAHRAMGAYGLSRIVGVVRRSNDGFRLAQPYIFSQLLTPAHSLGNWPINPLATRQEETRRYASTRWGRATNARRTSLHGF